MKYPRDITQFVADLAKTPGVHRIFLLAGHPASMDPVLNWQSGFEPHKPIMLEAGHYLHAEGEWIISPDDMPNMMTVLNRMRANIGLPALGSNYIANTRNGNYKQHGHWSGDIQFGFLD